LVCVTETVSREVIDRAVETFSRFAGSGLVAQTVEHA
jgi:hypothetical protein